MFKPRKVIKSQARPLIFLVLLIVSSSIAYSNCFYSSKISYCENTQTAPSSDYADMGQKVCVTAENTEECKELSEKQASYCCEQKLGGLLTGSHSSDLLAYKKIFPESELTASEININDLMSKYNVVSLIIGQLICYKNKFVQIDGGCSNNPPCVIDSDCTSSSLYGYCDSTKKQCYQKSCTSNTDCENGFCNKALAASSTPNIGVCQKFLECTSDSDCTGTQERCINDMCLRDADKDDYCHSDVPKKYCGGQSDCHDTSSLCQETCIKTDSYVLHPELKQKGNRNVIGYDCDDFCIDYDGDYACALESAKQIDDDMVSIIKAAGYDEQTFTGLGAEKQSDKIEDDYYKLDFKEIISNLKKNWKSDQKTFYDCDDKNESISPFTYENNQCNLVDDDCDGQIDECTRPLVTGTATWQTTPAAPIGGSSWQVGTAPVNPKEKLTGPTGGDNEPKGALKNSPKGPKIGGAAVLTGNAVEPLYISNLEPFTSTLSGVKSGTFVAAYNLLHDDSPEPIDKYECVYTTSFVGCRDWDYDQDGYMNSSFGCPDCNDCNDNDKKINPGAADCYKGTNCDLIDNNCNGLGDEMVDADYDDIIDYFTFPVFPFFFLTDLCVGEGKSNPLNPSGCWYNAGTRWPFGIPFDTVSGWSTE